ncbi:MAG: serine--tRNA ligase [Metamycoplasmataceae bacterium]
MLDIKKIQKDIDSVINSLKKRNVDSELLKKLSNQINARNKLIFQLSDLQHKRNNVTKEISLIKDFKNIDKKILQEASETKEKIIKLEKEIEEHQIEIENILHYIPNITHELVPIGEGEEENVEISAFPNLGRGLNKCKLPHYEIGVLKNILDFQRAVKISGSRFVFFKNEGALLVRALENFMLDQHISRGYTELIPPLMVSSKALFGTGQLPKFKEDVYKIENEDSYLISTSEIPLTNYYYDEIIPLNEPIKFTAYSPCFRSEAGSSGKDTKGLIRSHQFNKVEIVKITNSEDAFKEFNKTIEDAEFILKELEIPYRKIILCTGDTGFSSSITYDLELWLPSEQRYREVSSISYFGDFQARRAKIRYKDQNGKINFAHTINGSGLAIDRVIAAILEIYQNEDNSITVPTKLIPYMKGLKSF